MIVRMASNLLNELHIRFIYHTNRTYIIVLYHLLKIFTSTLIKGECALVAWRPSSNLLQIGANGQLFFFEIGIAVGLDKIVVEDLQIKGSTVSYVFVKHYPEILIPLKDELKEVLLRATNYTVILFLLFWALSLVTPSLLVSTKWLGWRAKDSAWRLSLHSSIIYRNDPWNIGYNIFRFTEIL